MRILLCDSDFIKSKELENVLVEEGHFIKIAYDSITAIDNVSNDVFDVIIYDGDSNRFNNLFTLKEIKNIHDIPFIYISNNIDKQNVLNVYELGALDFVRKPIIYEEIVYKLRVIFKQKKGLYFKYQGFEIDDQRRTISVDGTYKNLTEKEFILLVYLIKNIGLAIKREKLLNDVWGYGFFGDDRTIDTHIKKIRHALGKYRNLVKTIRGYGYKFEV